MRKKIYALVLAAAGAPLAAQPVEIEIGPGGDPGQLPPDQVIKDFSGVAAVVRDGKILHQQVSGIADLERHEPIRFDTRFNLASLGKLITKIAVVQLVAAGKLDLDKPVGAYLPGYPNREIREKATVRDLVDFKSGLAEIWNDRFSADPKKVDSLSDYMSLFADKPLKFAPGTRTEYSNSAYILLGRIVETLSGMNYPDYVQRYIAGPAGMTQTGYDRHDQLGPGIATGYKPVGMGDGGDDEGGGSVVIMRPPPGGKPGPNGPQILRSAPPPGDTKIGGGGVVMMGPPSLAELPVESNLKTLPARGSSAGGGYSSVPDFIKLDQALRNGALVPKERIGDVLGKGFAEGRGMAALAGGSPGVSTVAMFRPDGTTVIAFGNRDFPPADRLAEILMERYGKK